jgi:hypothetical protein
MAIDDLEKVIVGSGHHVLVISIEAAFKLVEDKVILVQAAQLGPQVLVHLICFDWPGVHIQVPDLN